VLSVLASRAADPGHYAVAIVKKAPARRNIDYFSKHRAEKRRALRHLTATAPLKCAAALDLSAVRGCGLSLRAMTGRDQETAQRPPDDGARPIVLTEK